MPHKHTYLSRFEGANAGIGATVDVNTTFF
jgi:hypothetical protein